MGLREDFIQIDKTGGKTQIHVCTITWEGPHSPVSRWVLAGEFGEEVGADEVEKAVTDLLSDRQYFRVCRECKERNPIGWMHDKRICQGCAERNHGVVH